MAEEDLTHDLNRRSCARCISGTMPPQIMWPQVNSHQLSRFLDHQPCCSVGYREDSLRGLNSLLSHVFVQAVGDLARNEDNFCLFAAFRISNDEFSALDISGRQVQYLTDSHPSPGHEFEHQTISRVGGSEDDLVDNFLFNGVPVINLRRSEEFLYHGCVAGILQAVIKAFPDEIEKGFDV